MTEKPDNPCPRCGRNQWEDSAGFGALQPTWTCGYCGLPAQDNPAPRGPSDRR